MRTCVYILKCIDIDVAVLVCAPCIVVHCACVLLAFGCGPSRCVSQVCWLPHQQRDYDIT